MGDLQSIAAITAERVLFIEPKVAARAGFPAGTWLAVADLAAIAAAPLTSVLYLRNIANPPALLMFWAVAGIASVALLNSYGGYSAAAMQRPLKHAHLAIRCYLAVSTTMLMVALLMGHAHAVDQHWTIIELASAPLLLILARAFPAPRAPSPGHAAAGAAVVICCDAFSADLSKAMVDNKMSHRIAGVLDLNGNGADSAAGAPLIADVKATLTFIKANNIQNIIVLHDPRLETMSSMARGEMLSDLLSSSARIWLAFDLAPQLPHRLVGRAGRYRLVHVAPENLVSSLNFTKRALDLLLGTALLCLAMPLIALIALLVRRSGAGPVIFRQMRTGAHGHEFAVLKFRTMHQDIGSPFAQARQNDSRVTQLGRFLRRSSLDELLQLVNVIKGEMSLVGPRPHAPETQVQGVDFENAVKYYRLRHRVKPGITGLAQIRGQRGETVQLKYLEERISSDLEYIETWSIWLDLAILVRTLPVFFRQQNAY